MIMLDQLKDVIEEIERHDDWAYKFVTDILERKEKNPDYTLSMKQFNKLFEIHDRYVNKKESTRR